MRTRPARTRRGRGGAPGKPEALSGWLRAAGIALAASALTLLASSGLVGAQSGGADQISACADAARGTLRMVAATETCAMTETRVVWNTQGPQGVPGAQGAAGQQGPPGT